jgi:hypothetical protein
MTEKTFWRTVRKNGTTGLAPADRATAEVASKWREGETRGGKLTKPRSIQFHRLAHAIGGLVAENLDDFHGMDAHRVIKRLQVESGVGCDEMAIRLGGQMAIHRMPKSLSFSTMAQDEFKEVMAGICHHLVNQYWPDTTVEEIEQMAQEYERGAA